MVPSWVRWSPGESLVEQKGDRFYSESLAAFSLHSQQNQSWGVCLTTSDFSQHQGLVSAFLAVLFLAIDRPLLTHCAGQILAARLRCVVHLQTSVAKRLGFWGLFLIRKIPEACDHQMGTC